MNRAKYHGRPNSMTTQIVVAALSLVLSYLFASLAINNGNIWFYVLFMAFLIVALRTILRLLMELYHGVFRK